MRYAFEVALLERFLNQDERALARAISFVEAGLSEGQDLLKSVRQKGGKARIIGITGSPGSGKSTLADKLIGVMRSRGRKVAVLAVDPSSPYSGGAILGDRIRMMQWHQDRDVFIRSMATRGHLGGLAAASLQVVALLDAYGFDDIFIETVGVGQSEVDIVQVADTTVLVLTPGQGDGVQAFKAGIMEVADVFAINKADLPGAHRLKREIKAALDLGMFAENQWRPPIEETIALQDEGIEDLAKKLDDHAAFLRDGGELKTAQRRRTRFEIFSIISEQVRLRLERKEAELVDAVLGGEKTPEEIVKEFIRISD